MTTPIESPSTSTTVPTGNNDADQIQSNLPCRSCGYNLFGLAADGRCPECGTSVAMSQRGDLLRFADPAWLRKLTMGTTWLMVSTIMHILSGCMVRIGAPGSFFSNVTPLALSIPALVGVWYFTTRSQRNRCKAARDRSLMFECWRERVGFLPPLRDWRIWWLEVSAAGELF